MPQLSEPPYITLTGIIAAIILYMCYSSDWAMSVNPSASFTGREAAVFTREILYGALQYAAQTISTVQGILLHTLRMPSMHVHVGVHVVLI